MFIITISPPPKLGRISIRNQISIMLRETATASYPSESMAYLHGHDSAVIDYPSLHYPFSMLVGHYTTFRRTN